MIRRNTIDGTRAWGVVAGAALAACLVLGACNRQQSSVVVSPGRDPQGACREAETRTPAKVVVQSVQPAPAFEEYPERLESLRERLQQSRRDGRIDEAVLTLTTLLDEVEVREGPAMAQRTAMAEAGNLEAQKDHRTAARAYELLLERYGDGPFTAEATYRLGGCHLELRDYIAAEQVWRKVIDQHGDSTWAPSAWRKLALVQLLQGHHDQSLATLAGMAAKYPGTEFEEYARMRRGYVLAAAERLDEARAAYRDFLASFPRSKYVRLVSKQMSELEAATLAKARP